MKKLMTLNEGKAMQTLKTFQKILVPSMRSIVGEYIQAKELNINVKSISLEDFLDDPTLKSYATRQGVSFEFFASLSELFPYTQQDWADYLGTTTRSLKRWEERNKDFGLLESEKIIDMAEMVYMGLEYFGDMDKFKLWLDRKSIALGGQCPLELIKDGFGMEIVKDELGRLEHGIYS